MIDHAGKAVENFKKGLNCSQAVLCAFDDMTGLDEKTALLIASSFGGGMGRLREVCGAVSGALMVLGLLTGYSDVSDPSLKKEHYLRVRDFAARFCKLNGSIVCRDLLKGINVKEGNEPEERNEEFYRVRPCARLIHDAARIADEIISEYNEKGRK